MDARTLSRLKFLFCVLAVGVASGCGTPRAFRGDSTVPPPAAGGTAAESAPPTPIPSGTVIAAGGTAAPTPTAPQAPAVPQLPAALPAPSPVPQPLPALPAVPANPPGVACPVPPDGARPLHSPKFADPHERFSPTAVGGRLGLAPYEVPTDRVVELTLETEAILAQNRALMLRIKELEAAGAGREAALEEARREAEAITERAAKTQTSLEAQVAALKGKLRNLEEDDVAFLRAALEALRRLVPPEKKP